MAGTIAAGLAFAVVEAIRESIPAVWPSDARLNARGH